ncbi:MAG: M56 family metallopeptidase [Pseudomonadota bacterium]|nr:M56 family metallopeptidase [Pseudomonadota bacterium]
MTPFDLLLVRLLLAGAGSLVAGAAVWAVAVSCRRWLPVLAQQRSPWLMGQVAVAVVFVALLLPTTERLRVVPVIELGDQLAAPTASAPTVPGAGAAAAPAPGPVPRDWLRDAARAWLALYLSGLLTALVRWYRAQRLLNSLAASGIPLAHQDAALPVMLEIAAPISPLLLGLFKPRLLLPRHLHSFAPLQQELVVEHELTHWRRRDLYWSAAAVLLQSLFWFNPFMYLLRARLGWAQEFGCDRDVLRGRPQGERRAYAAALVAQLKLQQGPPGMALAFGVHHAPTLATRVDLIRTPTAARGHWPRWTALGMLVAVAGVNLALQPALGVPRNSSARLDCTLLVDAASGATMVSEGNCDVHVTPASTFKIAISLMGFDSGVLTDANTPWLPYKTEYASPVPSWRHGTDPVGWLRESVVWYSQQVTGRLGGARVRHYVQAFDYGNRDIASVAGVDDAVAFSELSPTLRITPQEQTVFLRKLVNRELPVSQQAVDTTARLLKAATLANGWEVYGKTGTAAVERLDGSADDAQSMGWFVGWAVKGGRTVVFARLTQQPSDSARAAGPQTRASFIEELARRTL